MCGICGTYLNSNLNKSNIVNTLLLLQDINSINSSNFQKKIKKIESQISLYKSDINFLNYFYNSEERSLIKKIINNLKIVKKNNFLKDNSIVKDLIFNLEIELSSRYKFVKKYLNKKYYKNELYVIFLKLISNLINSINYLEMRGRDSLGLCLQIKINKKNIKKNDYKFGIYNTIREFEDFYILTFAFKTFNSIGSLRQNSEEILNQIFSNNQLITILNKKFDLVSMYFHTRWASVGKINLNNTHPISNFNSLNNKNYCTYSAVNGDIYNYKNILDTNLKKNVDVNRKCETDSIGLSIVAGEIFNKKNVSQKIKEIQKLKGSFCSCSISDLLPGEILLIKNGQQGLYLGKSVDRYYFSSDVYGLVEESNSYSKIDENCFITLPSNTKNEIKSYNLNKNKRSKYSIIKKFSKIEINLRDIYLGSNPHYFFKEINETASIIEKTNNKYFMFEKDFFSNPKINNLKKEFNNKKINKIIITGMGTCYTAAVAISYYMRQMISNYSYSDIIIQPHMASEGSGFYTHKNMNDHLVIVLGQSGTTIDTNTYAKIAKDRGAFTISFLNKRQGDLSYLVDHNIYIGDGRDVEISVPSTKTYLAHINLGYMFTLMLIQNKDNEEIINQEKTKLLNLPTQINKDLKNINDLYLEKILNNFCTNPNWYIIYDDSSLSVTNIEIKIKLSELCYKSIPSFHINHFIPLNITNSILIINTSNYYRDIEKNINILLKNQNTIMLVSHDKRFNLIKDKNFYFFIQENMPQNYELFSSIIFFQYFAYKLALKLNIRHKKLDNYLNEKNKNKLKIKYNEINKLIKNGFYNLDGLKDSIKTKLKNHYFKNNKNSHRDLFAYSKFLMRPIDTVKHQAKTITVGATRDTFIQNLHKKTTRRSTNIINNKKLENYFIYSNQLHESYIYDIVNRLTIIPKNKKYDFNLARSYDLKKISKKNLKFINIDNFSDNQLDTIITNNEYIKLTNKILKNFSGIQINDKKITNVIKNMDLKFIRKNLISKFKSIQNIKILGSGVNYNAAKILSLISTKYFKKAITYDILENHKHIDVSAEPYLIILLGNIDKSVYHSDSLSEIIKFSSHNNKCTILIDEINDRHYLKLPRDIYKIVHPKISEQDSFTFYLNLFYALYNNLKI